MSHLICSKLIWVSKVKQNNSGFLLSCRGSPSLNHESTNGVVCKFVISSSSNLLNNVLPKDLLLSTVAICKHHHWWSFDGMWKELGTIVGLNYGLLKLPNSNIVGQINRVKQNSKIEQGCYPMFNNKIEKGGRKREKYIEKMECYIVKWIMYSSYM
jgi:hypothetical protein